jgi:hypothetical protein
MQEGDMVPLWMSVEDSSYSSVMGAIAERRVPELKRIPQEVSELLKYAAFGIPRAYLAMLTEFSRGAFSTTQQGINNIIQKHISARLDEYKSLSRKVPRLGTLIERGEKVFNTIIRELKGSNEDLIAKDEKQLLVGVTVPEERALVTRLFNLLTEAGLLYEHRQVSHGGPDRTYQRFTPHLSALLQIRAFSGKERGSSPAQIVAFLQRKSSKHPLRRSMSTLLSEEELSTLRLDLPPCAKCGIERLSEQQRFCHNCGSELLDSSTFYSCMSIPLREIPGLTGWQLERMSETLPDFKSIGDLLAHQDPGTELRKIHRVGQRRAEKIIAVITGYVEEFLS